MSKVAMYLQEHISGEVVTNAALLGAMSRDGSVLEIAPEMVVYPRTTNDIRKVARFAWQLAEKGHMLPLTARGSGTDQTGAAIGKGIILSLPAHMNAILEFDAKQKLVRVQPGINAKALNDALLLHGVGIPSMPYSAAYSTVGGE
ncbi:MAG TPA: FAD-binding oxidoreductase [Candidatus Saccharimonadales bacterium]|nr:FAD-binding oxidoreductase [Candidatus Saccharimonadales bacterium]